MLPTYDVVVVGAGPIGITTACTLKAIHHHLRICVLDKRPEPQRNHGLRINADSVDKIQQILAIMQENASANSLNVKNLKEVFEGWRENFIRTSQIETDLAKLAKGMDITLLRDNKYKITGEDLAFSGEPVSEVQKIFSQARVIIGADGAHSVVRKTVMKDQFSYKEVLRHLVELKYQTDGQMQSRGYLEAFKDVSVHDRLTFETTSKDQSKPTKPVTFHLFVDEDTFKSLRRPDHTGTLKGVFGNSWTLKELGDLASNDSKVNKVYRQITDYISSMTKRGGTCLQEQISTLSLDVYKSIRSVEKHHEKYVLLVGDAESGLVLERGFNKGLKGAAICARAVSDFFYSRDFTNRSMPESFIRYERELLDIFMTERRLAKLKNMALSSVETSLYSSELVKDSSTNMSEASGSSCVLI